MMKPVREISFFYRFMTLRKVIVRSTEYAQPILLMQGILVDGLLWVGKQWGSQDNGKTSCILPIAFSAKKFNSIGIHRGAAAVIVIELWDYHNSLTQTGFKTFYTNGSYNEDAEVQWISIGK